MWNFTGKNRPSFAIEPSEKQESVWDYPRPPICVEDHREVIVRYGDLQIASTSASIRVLETASPPTFYISREDIQLDLLEPNAGHSFCEWKGQAQYWSLVMGDQRVPSVGWSYEAPKQAFAKITGYISFYPGKVECTVAGKMVRPQPGGFYGGWVTDEIVGPYKGESGTQGW